MSEAPSPTPSPAPVSAAGAPTSTREAPGEAETASTAAETAASSSQSGENQKPAWKPGRVTAKTFNTKRGPVTIEVRGKEAASPAAEGATGTPTAAATSTPAATATAAAEPAKAEDPKPHRALTIALEKEARLVEAQKAFKAEREQFEAQKAQLDADVKAIQQARTLVKEGKRLKALELLGVTLDEVQDEFLASVKEETPEEKAARIVKETLAAEREASAAAAKKAEEEAAAERTRVEQQRIDWYRGQIEASFKARASEFDPAAFEGVTAEMVQQRAFAECNATGKLPTASEALDLIQKDFDARLAKSARYAPKAATPPATTETAKDSPKAKATPTRTLTTKGAGSVPIVPRKETKKALTARERAHEAMRDLGVE